jgi:ADP-heptose:LPS heptosyltransferase
MSVPVIKALVKQNPDIKITILTRAFFKPLFEGLDNVQILTADVDNKHKGLVGLFRLRKELKLLKIDAIADIHNVLRSKFLRILSGLSQNNIAVIDKGRAEKKALTRSSNKIFKQLKTSHERYSDVFRQLGYKVDLSNPEFSTKEELINYPFNVEKEKGVDWIGIAPFAQYQSKMYPIDLMDELISLLSDTKKYQLFLFGGGKTEMAILEKLSSKYNNVINVAGKIKLKKELDLIAHLDLMLSMDSANSHLAAMLGVKTITLWGITHPFAGFAPFNQPFERMILPDLEKYPNIPCSIYGNKVCKGYEDVMSTISPEKIKKYIKRDLN